MGIGKMMHRAVFLDRDGVINKVILRDGKPYSPRKIDEFVINDGIKEVVQHLKEKGFKVFIISNQPDLARGEITQDVLDTMTQKVRSVIPIDDVYICPHDDYHKCSCRKPKPGMLIEAAKVWNIDLVTSFLIGDTWKDMEAGKSAGCKTILLDAPYNQDVQCDFRVKSVLECCNVIYKFTF
jgi:D-glycero-D-manno-heptose 1,7-bisphosphate phosphatase